MSPANSISPPFFQWDIWRRVLCNTLSIDEFSFRSLDSGGSGVSFSNLFDKEKPWISIDHQSHIQSEDGVNTPLHIFSCTSNDILFVDDFIKGPIVRDLRGKGSYGHIVLIDLSKNAPEPQVFSLKDKG